MDDLPALPQKQAILDEASQKVREVEEQYNDGLLTSTERHSKIIEIWTNAKEQVVKQVKISIPKINSIYAMVDSGARGSWGQVTQMVGMKGLVANPAGEIIELPVKASFKEGFSVLEFFISTHGSRKGLSDTALRTANAGYLTRRLVDVSQDVVTRMEDCGDEEGMVLTQSHSEKMGETLLQRITGRVLLQDIKDPETKKVIARKGSLITEAVSRKLEKINLQEAHVRSALRCRMPKGICIACYGYDLSHNKQVAMGTAVGIMAAQSIGEPGTQLTMRTFHTGGVAEQDITQGLPRVEELFEGRSPKRKAFMTDVAGAISIETAEKVIETGGKRMLVGQAGQKIIKITSEESGEERYFIDADDVILPKNDAMVSTGEVIIRRKNGPIVKAEHDGTISRGRKEVKVVYNGKQIKEYVIPRGYALLVKEGDQVEVGAALTEGNLDPHELYQLRGRGAVEQYLLQEIQTIYSSQGQKLNDKHIEVIVRQMFSRVLVKDAGDTGLLSGEVVELAEFKAENEKVGAKGKPALGDVLFLGITKAALATGSFLSAASFQETARVLINAAVTGKMDKLEGLKENVIIGRLIPAGTGFRQS